MDVARSGQARFGGVGTVSPEASSGYAKDDAALCHREVPGTETEGVHETTQPKGLEMKYVHIVAFVVLEKLRRT